MSSRKLEWSDDAERDLRGNSRFTRNHWGSGQRDQYLKRVSRAIVQLAQYPDLGQSRDEISPGLRTLPVVQHVIYYRVTEEAIRILRILHAHMDASAYFVS